MQAPRVDWSMGARAARLIDWRTASQVGRRLAGNSVSIVPAERARLDEQLAEAVVTAQELVTSFTGLTVPGSRPRAWVMSRGQWIDSNIASLERAIEPLAIKALGDRIGSSPWRTRALGAQLGALLGYVSRKVLGQYDVFLPPDDEGLLYFVGPNLAGMERQYRLRPEGFRLWLALHEVTHRVQFSGAPWLRGYITEMVDTYLSTMELDPKRAIENLLRALENVRERRGAGTMGLVFALMTPRQLELFHQMQAVMSLLEGHASYVMNSVGLVRIEDLDRMKRALDERRRRGGLERSFQRAIGFDQKIRQYGIGERFVAEIVEGGGMDRLNLAFEERGNLPTLQEIGEPERWLARVAPG